MRRGRKAWVFAIVTAVASASGAAAQAHSPSKRAVYHRRVSGTLHRSYIRSIGYGSRLYGLRAHRGLRGRTGRFVALVGDPDSGLGFYPLPIRYRIGACSCITRSTRGWRGTIRIVRSSATRTMPFVTAKARRFRSAGLIPTELTLRQLRASP
jgi:hypothetical protein